DAAAQVPPRLLVALLFQRPMALLDRIVGLEQRAVAVRPPDLEAEEDAPAEQTRQEQGARALPQAVADPLEARADRRVDLRVEQDVDPLLDREVAPRGRPDGYVVEPRDALQRRGHAAGRA